MSQFGNIENAIPNSSTRRMTGIALFTAVAVILNLSPLKFPAPFAPFLFYELWEIPIVAVLLIYGLYAAFTVELLNTIILLLVFPGALPTGPLYNFIAVVATLAATIVGQSIAKAANARPKLVVASATGIALLVRSAVMVAVNFVFLPLPAPLGYQIPQMATLPLLPLIAFFNATVVLYSVPLGYGVVKAMTSRFKTKTAYGIT